jgi:hypothetical protein
MRLPPVPARDDDRSESRAVAPVDTANDHRQPLCTFRACRVCGAELPQGRNSKARRERVYCSDACRARAWRRQRAAGGSKGSPCDRKQYR